MRRFRKKQWLILAAGLIVAGWVVSSGVVTWKLTRRSAPTSVESLPSVTWGEFEAHRLTTADGEEIGAWLVRQPDPAACAVVLHGNRASRSARMPTIKLLAEHGCAVLAVSHRAHGDSTGEVNDLGYSARHDVVAAVDFMRQQYADLPIFLVARSLGAAAAIYAAGELDDRVDGYFLEQPYLDVKTATWNRLQCHLAPGFDGIAYAGMRMSAPLLVPVELEQLDPSNHIANIPANVPVIIITGDADPYLPLKQVQQLHAQVGSHAQLVVFSGAAHVPLDRHDPARYREALLTMLKNTRRPGGISR